MKKIIVIDDSRIARVQVARALPASEFEIVEGIDGIDGVAKVRANSDAALIVCDVNMPRMNGLDVLAAVKEESTTTHIPFLMLTTEAEPSIVREAKARGALAWLIKPIKPESLLATVRKVTS